MVLRLSHQLCSAGKVPQADGIFVTACGDDAFGRDGHAPNAALPAHIFCQGIVSQFPKPNGVALIDTHKLLSTRGESDLADPIPVSFEFCQFLEFRIPNANCSIGAGCGDSLTVWRIGNGPNGVAVAFKFRLLGAIRDGEDFGRLIGGGGGDALSIGRESNLKDRRFVGLDALDLGGVGCLANGDRAIFAGEGKLRTVRQDGDAANPAFAFYFVSSNFFGNVPNDDLAVITSADQGRAIRGKRDGPHARTVSLEFGLLSSAVRVPDDHVARSVQEAFAAAGC